MLEPRMAKFQWGQRVVAGVDLVNDGSYPDREADALLVAQGSMGEIVQIGQHVDTDTPIYLVEFGIDSQDSCVVGCMEEEINPA
ncbi:MAG: nitrogen fixation protein NifZ [Betaproteobacteria bacterium]|nr:nitrogen fixation protein NifZ [Betaproteobacteria bacterium]